MSDAESTKDKNFAHIKARYANRFTITAKPEGSFLIFGESDDGTEVCEVMHTRLFLPHHVATQIGPLLTQFYAQIQGNQAKKN